MGAAKLDFTRREGEENTYLQQNSSFFYELTWETETEADSGVFAPVPMPGWTAKMQIRRKANAPVVLELSTANNRIILDPANGTIQLQVANTDTATLAPGLYQYDLHLINQDGFTITLVEGLFEIVSGITQ